jgi:glutamyl-tRNA synthetase
VSKTIRTTRLAPSPTGTLHLGNARTFLINWAIARQNGWRIVMRIEDLDLQRVRPEATELALQLIAWLGMDYDEGPLHQSHDLEPYRRAMDTLAKLKRTYLCELTRKQVQQATSAPHAGETEQRFPPQLRPSTANAFSFDRADANFRFVVKDVAVDISDEVAGFSRHHPFSEVGDFIIWTKLGVPSYQLAVVVDDARQGVTDVVRGNDLLPSAARQTLLYEALGLTAPKWWHLPMVFAEGGQRLAKRNNDSHLQTYQAAGVRPERIIGLIAFWSGAAETRTEMSADDFRHRFRMDNLSASPITFTQGDHAWLLDET